MDYEHNYYAATINDDHQYPQLEDKISTKVCIIGAGFAGIATAYGLLERGIDDVVILESNRIGFGASGRNGGFCFGGYSLHPQQMLKQLGQKKTKHLYDFTTSAVDLIRQRIKKYNIQCDLQEQGVLLANWFNRQQLLDEIQTFIKCYLQTEWQPVSTQQLATEIITQRYYGGLLEPNAFHFHPLNYVRALTKESADMGLQIYEQSNVISIDEGKEKIIVKTSGGFVTANEVVICCGGYVGKLFPRISRAILPIASYIAVTEPLGDRLSSVMKKSYAVYDTRFAFDYYRPLVDSRLLWGGRISVKQNPTHLKKILYKDMMKVFPQLEDINFDYCWSGLMGYCTHQMPLLGRLNNIWYAIGFGGHGVAPTTVGGELIAAAIAEGDQTYQSFTHYPVKNAYGFLGLAGSQTMYWYYQIKDWFKNFLSTRI